MSPRLKSGPRTEYGYLDAALQDLARQVEETGKDSEPVRNKRRALLERVRRIVRADRKRWCLR